MRTKVITESAITGIEIMLSYPELIFLKGFKNEIDEYLKGVTNTEFRSKNQQLTAPIMEKVSNFIGNLIPEGITSLDEAANSLFAPPLKGSDFDIDEPKANTEF